MTDASAGQVGVCIFMLNALIVGYACRLIPLGVGNELNRNRHVRAFLPPSGAKVTAEAGGRLGCTTRPLTPTSTLKTERHIACAVSHAWRKATIQGKSGNDPGDLPGARERERPPLPLILRGSGSPGYSRSRSAYPPTCRLIPSEILCAHFSRVARSRPSSNRRALGSVPE